MILVCPNATTTWRQFQIHYAKKFSPSFFANCDLGQLLSDRSARSAANESLDVEACKEWERHGIG